MIRLIIFFIIFLVSLRSNAQDIDTTTVDLQGVYMQEFSLTQDTILQKEAILERAIKEALQTRFGIGVFAMNIKEGYDDGNNTTEKFSQYSENIVRGEWLKTTETPYFEFFSEKKGRKSNNKNSIILLKCTVKGKGRLYRNTQTTFDAMPKRCVDLRCKTTDFIEGDRFYMWLKSNTEGFVSIFLVTPKKDWIQCLLDNAYVKANKDYSLFEPSSYNYAMFRSDDKIDKEMNIVYVVFSKNTQTFPLFQKDLDHYVPDSDRGMKLPETASYKKFSAWLGLNLSSQLQYKRINIIVNGNDDPFEIAN
jgi:hypothetical protein